jgi:uncharacterized protein
VTLLRPITPDDVSVVLALNDANVELLAPLDEARLNQLRTWARHADVIVCDGEVAGFVLTFGPGTAYDSPNYRWFTDRYGRAFLYLDRIVLDDRFRRRGLGGAVYDAIEADAAPAGRLALEVNIEPPNEPSLAFHRRRGYVEVGRLGKPGGEVSLMVKSLSAV